MITTNEINTGVVHQDLILNIHYRDLKKFPYYVSEINTGAMVMKQILDYLMWNSTTHPNGPPSVYNEQTLYNSYKGSDAIISGNEITYGLNHEIDDQHHNWQYGYFFNPYNNTDVNQVLKQICIWLDYPVDYYNYIRDVDVPKPGHPNHVPIAVPTGGNYNSWIAIRGIHTDKNAWLPPTQLVVKGFWVNDPKNSGLGTNTYITASRFVSTYYLPLNVPGDAHNGKYLAVTDPARNQTITTDIVHVTIAEQTAGFTTKEARLVNQHNKGISSDEIDNIIIRTAYTEAMKVLQYDPIAETFAGSHVLGKPLYDKDTCSVTFIHQDTRITVMINKQTGALLEIHIENDATQSRSLSSTLPSFFFSSKHF